MPITERIPVWPYTFQRLRQDVQLVDLWLRNAAPPEISTDRYVAADGEQYEGKAILNGRGGMYDVYEACVVKSAIDLDYFEHMGVNATLARHVDIHTAISLLDQWTQRAVDGGYKRDALASLGGGVDYRTAALVFNAYE